MLSFHIVSHIGYMIFGLALFTLAASPARQFDIVHHIVVKSSLFLVACVAEFRAGTDRLSRLGGMVRSTPTIAVLFDIACAEHRRDPAVLRLRGQVRNCLERGHPVGEVGHRHPSASRSASSPCT